MKNFFTELHRRNPLLFVVGWVSLAGALICAMMTQVSDTVVLGISAYIKPMKFFLSICAFTWTMGWYLEYLHMPRKTLAYSIMAIVVFLFELSIITWQASNGRLSHFNISTPMYALLFNLMGVAIVILWSWTCYITFLFFRRQFDLPQSYLWGIRLGLIIFLIFSIEGAAMAARLAHTIGAPDGGPGLPIVNWSKQHGDLRVAHFFGMHALQIIPVLSYYVFKKSTWVMVFATFYFLFVSCLLIQALNKIPLFF